MNDSFFSFYDLPTNAAIFIILNSQGKNTSVNKWVGGINVFVSDPTMKVPKRRFFTNGARKFIKILLLLIFPLSGV